MLKKEDKEKLIQKLADSFTKSKIVIATDYRGLTAKEMVTLRRQLRDAGVDYKVAKNTLTRFAAEKTGNTAINDLLSGPLAIAISYDDIVRPARVLNDFVKSSGDKLQIKGGLLDNKFISKDSIVMLANTPPREVLIARLLGHLASPLQTLHGLLSAPLQNLLWVLKARAEQVQ